MTHCAQSHHIYCGSSEQAKPLMDWLMSKGYWFEYSKMGGEHMVKCGVEPEKLDAALRAALEITP